MHAYRRRLSSRVLSFWALESEYTDLHNFRRFSYISPNDMDSQGIVRFLRTSRATSNCDLPMTTTYLRPL